MRRIPFPGNPNGVWDNFEDANESSSPRTEGRADATIFGIFPDPAKATTPDGLQRVLVEEIVKQQGIRPDEAEFFANRIQVFLTSSEERRYGQWEHTTWWDFVRAEGKSDEYKKLIARGLTRSLVAAKETVASTRTIGNMAEAFIMNIQQRGNDGALDRVLNAPTNEAWIDPWVLHLRKLGVRFRVGPDGEGSGGQAGADRRGHGPRPPRPAAQDRGRLVRLRDAGRAGAAPLVAQGPAARPASRGDERALRGLDGRDPVLPAAARRADPRPPDLRGRALGPDGAHPGPVLEGQRRLRP